MALGSDAMPLLLRLLHDADPDVRGYALDAIGVVQPEALAKLVPQLRRQLGSPNDAEALRAAWALVQLRDVDSLADVEALRDRHRDQPSDARFRAADVAVTALADPETVATAIRNHDHEHMPWLGYAASLIDSPECVAALAWGREELPDDACRAACARWVPG